MFQAMKAADPAGGLRKSWQAEELLLHLLKLAGTEPAWALLWQRLTHFQMFCAERIDIRRRSAASPTPSTTGVPEIIEGIFTGISNGRPEGYNRIVKHIGRIAFGFAQPHQPETPIRFACTRASRRAATTLKPC